MPKSEETEEKLAQSEIDNYLNVAVTENGYTDLVTWDVAEVALDMVDRIADYNDNRPSELMPYIRDWQQRYGGNLVEFKWKIGESRFNVARVPEKVLRDSGWASQSLVDALSKNLAEMTEAQNRAALETITLGRRLSITTKALSALQEVLVAVSRLRRLGGDGSPISEAMAGYLATQEATELDQAIIRATERMDQLSKEYPKDEPTSNV